MVGVAVEVDAGGEGAQGVALALSFGVTEEFEVVDLSFPVVEILFAGVVFEERTADDDLVEEVPLRAVGEGADTLVEN